MKQDEISHQSRDRAFKALDLRESGKTFREIAEYLGVSNCYACDLVAKGRRFRDRLKERGAEPKKNETAPEERYGFSQIQIEFFTRWNPEAVKGIGLKRLSTFSVRIMNCILNSDLKSDDEIIQAIKDKSIWKIRNLGKRSIERLMEIYGIPIETKERNFIRRIEGE